MSDDGNEARQALSVLRDRPVSVDAERLAARRARVIAAISREASSLGAARQRRRIVRAGGAAFAIAAAAAVVLLVAQRFLVPASSENPPALTFVGSVGETIAHGNRGSRSLHPGEALAEDPGRIETAAAGSAELVTQAGLGLRLAGATRVSLAALIGPGSQNQIDLQQGELTCTVPHLQEGQRFSVRTPGARVVVHGTVFSVRVDPTRALGKETCVEVTEGVVIVQHQGSETALNAGDHWGCDAEPSAPPEIAPASAPSASASATLPKGTPSRVVEHGTLARESELFQRALAAERLGRRSEASALLGQLLTRYPSSPLAPEARRALARVTKDP